MEQIARVRELIGSGVKPGEPKSHGPLTLIPLFGGALTKEYVLAAEAFADGLLSITEVDEGSVPQLGLINRADLPVLLLDGEHLEGAMQNRIVNASVLVAANSEAKLPVACVEHGRWHYEEREDFAPSDDFAYGRLRAKNASARAVSARVMGRRSVDQGEVWADISALHTEMGVEDSPTESMRDAYDRRRSDLDDIVSAWPSPEPGQTGVLVCVAGHPIALDSLDRPETLSKLWARLLSGYALDALGRDSAPLEDSAVGTFLRTAAAATATTHKGLGLGTDVVLTGDRIVGNALTWDEGVVHVALFARPDGRDDSTESGHIAGPRARAQRLLDS